MRVMSFSTRSIEKRSPATCSRGWIESSDNHRERSHANRSTPQLYSERSLFTEQERVALAYAEAVTLRSDAIDEGLIGQLKTYFDDDAIVELTALAAFQDLSSKFNSALAVSPRDSAASYPPT
jgi:alkylhydroperoxidase family enzyme